VGYVGHRKGSKYLVNERLEVRNAEHTSQITRLDLRNAANRLRDASRHICPLRWCGFPKEHGSNHRIFTKNPLAPDQSSVKGELLWPRPESWPFFFVANLRWCSILMISGRYIYRKPFFQKVSQLVIDYVFIISIVSQIITMFRLDFPVLSFWGVLYC
jgi:hypothetical protein